MLPGRRPSFSAGLACASLGVHSSPSLALKSRPDSRINGAIIMNRPYRFRAISTAVLVSSFLLFTTAKQTTQARIPTPPPTGCSTTTIDMKLLVVTNGKTESDFPAIKQILDYLGTPYDVLDMTVSTGGITSSMLSEDRKSTRLNSSHRTISYAVFCLKKKKKKRNIKINKKKIKYIM